MRPLWALTMLVVSGQLAIVASQAAEPMKFRKVIVEASTIFQNPPVKANSRLECAGLCRATKTCSAFYWNNTLCYMNPAAKLGGPDLNPVQVYADASFNSSKDCTTYIFTKTNGTKACGINLSSAGPSTPAIALQRCVDRGARLPEAADINEFNQLATLWINAAFPPPKGHWIGGNDTLTTWVWISQYTGKPLRWTSFVGTQPDGKGSQHCLLAGYISPSTQLYEDCHCTWDDFFTWCEKILW